MSYGLVYTTNAREQLRAAIQAREGDPTALFDLRAAYGRMVRTLLADPAATGEDHPDGSGRRVLVQGPVAVVYEVRRATREVVVWRFAVSERG